MAVLQGGAFSMIGVKYDYRGPDEYKMPAFDYWLAEKNVLFLGGYKRSVYICSVKTGKM